MVCAFLLLAGAPAARWGCAPALLPHGGDCLVNHLARTALEVGGEPVVRVLGAHALAVSARPAPAGVIDVFNPAWARGPGSHIACGLRAALRTTEALGGVVIVPCAPTVLDASWCASCVEAVLREPARIVQADGADLGGPLGFGRAHFAELLALDGEADARHVLQRHLRHRLVMPAPAARPSVSARAAASGFLGVTVHPGFSGSRPVV